MSWEVKKRHFRNFGCFCDKITALDEDEVAMNLPEQANIKLKVAYKSPWELTSLH